MRQRHTIERGSIIEFKTAAMAHRELGRVHYIFSHDLGFSKSFKLTNSS